ncbi:MAG TPA: MoaD/ThiS family protein [Anaerolineaceae bacterium]|nr:MoaD/ThiS family protein [Anaerolineaceae bacterium]
MRSDYFPLLEEANIDIKLDVWLYGALRLYAKGENQIGFAQLAVTLPEGSCMRELLAKLEMPSKERGITFVNGNLSALPGFQPDLGHVFQDGDRVALFDLKSMWPFQYRNGAAMTDAMRQAIIDHPDQLIHHDHENS